MLRRANEQKLYLKAMLYGRPGSGKTTLASSGHSNEAMGETLVADFEDGTLSISDTSALVTPLLRTLKDIEQLYMSLVRRDGEFAGIGTLVIDSGTKLQEVIITHVMESVVAAGATMKNGEPRTLDDIELQDYGKATRVCTRVLQKFRDLPMNVIITALAKETSPQATVQKPYPPPTDCRPDFMAKVGERVMAAVDHVWLLARADDGQHSMLTQRAGIYTAKTRGAAFSKELGTRVDNPNLSDIFDLLQSTQGAHK